MASNKLFFVIHYYQYQYIPVTILKLHGVFSSLIKQTPVAGVVFPERSCTSTSRMENPQGPSGIGLLRPSGSCKVEWVYHSLPLGATQQHQKISKARRSMMERSCSKFTAWVIRSNVNSAKSSCSAIPGGPPSVFSTIFGSKNCRKCTNTLRWRGEKATYARRRKMRKGDQ